MLDNEPTGGPGEVEAPAADIPTEATPTRRRRAGTKAAAKAAAPAPEAAPDTDAEPDTAADEPPKKRARRATKTATKTATKAATRTKAAAEAGAEPVTDGHADAPEGTAAAEPASQDAGAETAPAPAPAKRTRASRSRRAATADEPAAATASEPSGGAAAEAAPSADTPEQAVETAGDNGSRRPAPPTVMFVAPALQTAPATAPAAERTAERTDTGGDQPDEPATPSRRRRTRAKAAEQPPAEAEATEPGEDTAAVEADDDADGGDSAERRRRRRGRRGRGKNREGADAEGADADDQEASGRGESAEADEQSADEDGAEAEHDEESGATRRRRRRRRRGSGGDGEGNPDDDPPNTVVHVREARSVEDEVQAVRGSTRLEAKRQRRRDGREQGRRRPPILTESEFLARREAVERVMAVRQRGDRTQIAVLEDGVLVEHYVSRANSTSYAGNVYIGRVQNVLPSMEAAFIDIGKGRNAVLYAGEVNWDAAGLDGRPRQIEQVLKSGDTVLVQVTKDPLGHKGARLTSQISLPGRYLVYVPSGSMTGISRKLPDTERQRLKDILKRIVPEDAGVIIRTAAEGASEEELGRDIARLQAQWEIIQKKASSSSTSVPSLLYAEPDLAIRVVRDIFNEDFGSLVVSGDEAWDTLEKYVAHVAPDLVPRLHRHTGTTDLFTEYRIDEQLAKALDRKVWLPSGGSLIIDRTEAMAVVDVNTGKFTGGKSGSSLEETVTRNNLEAAEEIVRQLRLRDIGGIIVIDFIDMVLESNRELVLRRLTECLGRDRTKHQVAEVTSLGLVQMTRKRVGQGLLEAFSESCEVCKGRGVIVHTEPVDDGKRQQRAAAAEGGGRRRKGRSAGAAADEPEAPEVTQAADADEAPTAEDVEVAAAAVAGVSDDAVQQSPGASEEPDAEPAPRRRRRRAASRPAGPPTPSTIDVDSASA